ncbi:peptide chain release factor 1 [Candidatus Berkelbacteria bacterium CG_4_8_14_3_um_filter_33_6]|uniref:Peptide chain release factor 1 n=1 Tax=Candidatus Berkelbacteria bacterium CG_4_10_14_0_2_um_filter_35_9_33_12 TaxID=1974499 RepID=A0A2M7W4E5_9BACT|nr:MAG: peptide chain release factor 1 [Candidatus Berkelbacteria bacterium CG23_combo_of_CG06-09_8_20_14_all_33_15]PIS08544.1 MAG: peptide chain release factor 1 [Candidatus Berkelbacteria bacterium CG10_big_fil_rev_8_21_14_0_10_33_10]PIX31165.1 MAG: peptide chain release factor 1 [Candidatus Berkelbacteria bacterium CG_4_8_14_3_um_filter_33_6]PJA20640.1 MAG: peptide chain release factor 1 [Candidatus Berkelbacteria bacterium CG_4_10_14_0_2_um_filter_35_9_33_12]HBW58379.1 peptide chain release
MSVGGQVKSISEQLKEAQAIYNSATDLAFKNMAQEEIEKLKQDLKIKEQTNLPNNAILEIRAGAGGDEAELFASDLLKMYLKYAEKKAWKINTIEQNTNNIGGIKSVFVELRGERVYTKLQNEGGVHRVQRIPETEKKGRVHTSTATVAIIPEVENEEIELKANDIRVDVFRAKGHGGQGVNTTDSAVRITHLPTNIVISIQDERSQIKNRDKALKILKGKLYTLRQSLAGRNIANQRSNQVGTGDRSEKIRTYNFPQDRVTDHRLKKSFSNLEKILAGNLDTILEKFDNYKFVI